jgi:dihydrofolate reductase
LHDRTDAVIWGRRTYELMAGYWLTVPGNPASTPAELEHARFLDTATKIVVSRTLERVAWNNAQNTVLIQDHIAEAINTIKTATRERYLAAWESQAGADVHATGSD